MNNINYFNNKFNDVSLSNSIFRRIVKIHFIGIGGSGMSGIAEVLYNLGFQITGSDLNKNEATIRLTKMGVSIVFCHIAENVAYCDAVVVSSAIPLDNIELLIAKKRKIPIIHRAEMLAELMRFKYGIAIAGSHGKTTTTSLIATILAEANQDPTFVVGGKLNKFSSNAKLGTGDFFVVEADESDGSFLHLSPLLAVIVNIDNDHLCNYGGDVANLRKAFLEFINRLPFYGLAIVCIDDPIIAKNRSDIARPLLSYGFSEEADLRAMNYEQELNVSKFQVLLPGEATPREVILNLPGKHNVLNALAAIAVGLELKIDFNIIAKTLLDFHGISRRFQIHGQFYLDKTSFPKNKSSHSKKFLLLDDYGHHPKEIESVITAIKDGWPKNRLVIVFQPHRYSRTQQLFDDFAKVLSYADYVILLDIYSAEESPIFNITSQHLLEAICTNYQVPAILIPSGNIKPDLLENTLLDVLMESIKDNDLLLMQGAGDIGKLTRKLIDKLTIYQECEELKV